MFLHSYVHASPIFPLMEREAMTLADFDNTGDGRQGLSLEMILQDKRLESEHLDEFFDTQNFLSRIGGGPTVQPKAFTCSTC